MAGPTASELKRLASGGERPEDVSAADLKKAAATETLGTPADFGRQFLSGLDDVTRFIARPLEERLGTVGFGPEGIELRGPGEEPTGIVSGTRPGFPGQAEEEPSTLLGRSGRLGGQTAAAGPALGRVAGLVRSPGGAAASRTGRVGQFIQRQISRAGETFHRAPGASTAAETTLGATAGAGGFAAGELFPESDAATFVGDIIGGTAPAFMPASLAIRGGKSLLKFLRRPFTETGGRRRARARAKRASPGEARTRALSELDQPTTRDPETGEPVLTAAQRTGDPGMLALERAVVESSESLAREADEQIASANRAIRGSMEGIAEGGDPAATAATIEEGQQYLSGLLDTRVRIAAQRADERIAQLGEGATAEQANRIAREEVDKALAAARAQERQLFSAVDPEVPVPTSNAQDKLTEWQNALGKAQRGDVPAEARRFLQRRISQKKNPDFLGDETTILELRGLQSKLRETARNARSGEKKNLTKAKIADELADSLTEDIANARGGPEASEAVEAAVGFSRKLNERFNRGTVGKLTGRRATGEPAVPESLTLEQSLGMGGPRGAQALDDLKKAFDSPEAPDSQMMIGATSDYLRQQFLKKAVQNGQVNARQARTFIDRNREILERLPDVRQELESAVEAGNARVLRESQRQRVQFDNPKLSRAAMFTQKGPVEAFRQLTNESPSAAAREVQKLINRAQRDQTGEAMQGLKAGFLRFLQDRSLENTRDVAGERLISGFALRDALRDPKVQAMMSRVLTEGERRRLRTVMNDSIKLERARQARPPGEGVIGDKPSKVVETVAGITGAAAGRQSAANVGVGGTVQIPGIMANRFRDLVAAGVNDPAERLMRDAIADETLFRELLQASIDESGELGEQATRRLNAWAASVLAENGGAFEADQAREREAQGGQR